MIATQDTRSRHWSIQRDFRAQSTEWIRTYCKSL